MVVCCLTLTELLKKVRTEKDPAEFKEALLSVAQVYFDVLIEENRRKNRWFLFWKKKTIRGGPEIWAEQEEALKALLSGIQMTVSGFYRNNRNVSFSDVKEVVLPHDSALIKYGVKKVSKRRHLYGLEGDVGGHIPEVVKALEGEKINLIIPIASGGFEPAALTADYLGVDYMLPVRYSYLSKDDLKVLIPQHAPDDYSQRQIKGSNVLIVEDIIASGRTASQVTKWAKKYSPAKVYLSAISILGGLGCYLNSADMCVSNQSEHLYHEKKRK